MTTRPMSGSGARLWETMREQLTDDSFDDVRQRLTEVLAEKDAPSWLARLSRFVGRKGTTGEDVEAALAKQARHNGHVEVVRHSYQAFMRWVGYGG